jgi:hypothetical protein
VRYGLTGNVWTGGMGRALHAAAALEGLRNLAQCRERAAGAIRPCGSRAGDAVEIECVAIGVFRNRVIDEVA